MTHRPPLAPLKSEDDNIGRAHRLLRFSIITPTEVIIPERIVPMLLKFTSKTRKGEKPKHLHLIPVHFKIALTIDLAKSVVRRALLLAQAVKCANQAAWEAAPHLSMDPTVLPLPVPKKSKPTKKVRRLKRRKMGHR